MPSRPSLIVPAVAVVGLVALVSLAVGAVALARTLARPRPAPDPRVSLEDALDALESRLETLEAARRGEPGGPAADPGILARLDRLERRLEALTAPGDASPPSSEAPPPDAPVASRTAEEEPGPEDIERFRKLAEAVGRQRQARKNRGRIEKMLAEQRIVLSEDQRDRLVEAYGAFEGRRNEIWGAAKRRGAAAGGAADWAPIIAETRQTIVQEFTERISPFIPAGDAELIARSLLSDGK